MSPSKRKSRAEHAVQHSEVYAVLAEHGGSWKVCARRRKKDRVIRIGTFARCALGSKPTVAEMKTLVRESILRGVVLKIEESAALLLAHALAEGLA